MDGERELDWEGAGVLDWDAESGELDGERDWDAETGDALRDCETEGLWDCDCGQRLPETNVHLHICVHAQTKHGVPKAGLAGSWEA